MTKPGNTEHILYFNVIYSLAEVGGADGGREGCVLARKLLSADYWISIELPVSRNVDGVVSFRTMNFKYFFSAFKILCTGV